MALEPALMDRLAGEYLLDGADKPTLWLMRAGDRLMLRTEGGQPQPLEAESPTRLATPNDAVRLERDATAEPVKFRVTLAPGEPPKAFTRRAEKPAVALNAAQLQPLAGTYKTSGGHAFTVTVEGDALLLSVGSPRGFRLQAESSTEFTARMLNARVVFVREGDGPAVELRWTQLGATTVAKRS